MNPALQWQAARCARFFSNSQRLTRPPLIARDSRMKPYTRRKFLKKSVLGAPLVPLIGANIDFPFFRSARAGEPPASEKIRLGLIGSGGMGRGDLECFFLNPEVDCA